MYSIFDSFEYFLLSSIAFKPREVSDVEGPFFFVPSQRVKFKFFIELRAEFVLNSKLARSWEINGRSVLIRSSSLYLNFVWPYSKVFFCKVDIKIEIFKIDSILWHDGVSDRLENFKVIFVLDVGKCLESLLIPIMNNPLNKFSMSPKS